MFDRVTPVQKQEARDLFRLAKRRGFHLSLTKEQLNDPKCVGRFLAIYGNPPSDREYRKAVLIAKHLRVRLTPEQAMNKWHCRKFINDNKTNIPGGAPSDKQIRLAEQLADYHEIVLSDEVRVSLDEWNAFFAKHLGREEIDYLHEIQIELSIRIDFGNFGNMMRYLTEYKGVLDDPTLLREAKEDRARVLLLNGEDPFTVAEDLELDIDRVLEIERELEAEPLARKTSY